MEMRSSLICTWRSELNSTSRHLGIRIKFDTQVSFRIPYIYILESENVFNELALAMYDRNRVDEFNIRFTNSDSQIYFTNLFITGDEICMIRVNSSEDNCEFLKITFIIVIIIVLI